MNLSAVPTDSEHQWEISCNGQSLGFLQFSIVSGTWKVAVNTHRSSHEQLVEALNTLVEFHQPPLELEDDDWMSEEAAEHFFELKDAIAPYGFQVAVCDPEPLAVSVTTPTGVKLYVIESEGGWDIEANQDKIHRNTLGQVAAYLRGRFGQLAVPRQQAA